MKRRLIILVAALMSVAPLSIAVIPAPTALAGDAAKSETGCADIQQAAASLSGPTTITTPHGKTITYYTLTVTQNLGTYGPPPGPPEAPCNSLVYSVEWQNASGQFVTNTNWVLGAAPNQQVWNIQIPADQLGSITVTSACDSDTPNLANTYVLNTIAKNGTNLETSPDPVSGGPPGEPVTAPDPDNDLLCSPGNTYH